MGNLFDSDAEAQSNKLQQTCSTFDASETLALEKLFNYCKSDESDSIQMENIKCEDNVLKFRMSTLFGVKAPMLAHYGLQLAKEAQDIASFVEVSQVLLCRNTAQSALQTVFDALDLRVQTENTTDASVEPDTSPALMFMLLLQEMAESLSLSVHKAHWAENAEDMLEIAKRMHLCADAYGNSPAVLSPFPALSTFVWEQIPYAPSLISTFYYQRLDLEPGASWQPFVPPYLTDPAGRPHAGLVPTAALLPLALHSKCMQGELRLLYSTFTHGIDFLNIKDAISGYSHGTLFVLRVRSCVSSGFNEDSEAIRTIGAYAAASWKDTKDAYGAAEGATFSGFAFSLVPHLRLYKADCCQYLNTKSFDKSVHGIGLGAKQRTAQIPADFAVFLPQQLDRKVLLYGQPFELDSLEIFAAGGQQNVQAGLEAQKQNKKQAQLNLERARTVDRAAFFANEFDRQMFLSNTFAHEADVRNRDM